MAKIRSERLSAEIDMYHSQAADFFHQATCCSAVTPAVVAPTPGEPDDFGSQCQLTLINQFMVHDRFLYSANSRFFPVDI